MAKKHNVPNSDSVVSDVKDLAMKKSVRDKFELSEKKLRLREKQLVTFIKEDEDVRRKLTLATEKLKESYGVLDQEVIENTIELKNSYATLEQMVIDRTQALENANIAVQNVLEDLNEEKTKLEVAKAKEEAMLLSIGEGLLVCDKNKNIILMNESAEKMLGWKISESIGKYFYEIITAEEEGGLAISPERRPFETAIMTNSTTKITVTDRTCYYIRKDKTRFPVAIVVTPIILNGEVIGAIDVFSDITSEKEVDRAKTEVVSLTSHQLRTPLTSIRWYTELLLNGDGGQITSDQKKYLDGIYDCNNRMVDMINDFLNVSRIELGTYKYEPKPIDIIELINSVIDEQKPRILGKKLIVTENSDGFIPKYVANPDLIRMVFQNLLSNSVKYTPAGGKVKVMTSSDSGKSILVKISDTGIGIPKEQKSKIFIRLFRADNARLQGSDGTGLGLYLAKSIIEKSGGRIWFKSKENEGSTFYVELPVNSPKGTINKK